MSSGIELAIHLYGYIPLRATPYGLTLEDLALRLSWVTFLLEGRDGLAVLGIAMLAASFVARPAEAEKVFYYQHYIHEFQDYCGGGCILGSCCEVRIPG